MANHQVFTFRSQMFFWPDNEEIVAIREAVMYVQQRMPEQLAAQVEKVGVYYTNPQSNWGIEYVIGWQGRDIGKRYMQFDVADFKTPRGLFDKEAFVTFLLSERVWGTKDGVIGTIKADLRELYAQRLEDNDELEKILPQLAGLEVQQLLDPRMFLVEPKSPFALFGEFLEMLEERDLHVPTVGENMYGDVWMQHKRLAEAGGPWCFLDRDTNGVYRRSHHWGKMNVPVAHDRRHDEQFKDGAVLVYQKPSL